MAKILNIGSINIDYVYAVPHFARAGETIASDSLQVFPGGKGLNQSIAIARAGSHVIHAGMVGDNGIDLVNLLKDEGVDIIFIGNSATPTGHAIIQVNDEGQNCILLYPGANRELNESYIDRILESFGKGDIVIMQNHATFFQAIGAGRNAPGFFTFTYTVGHVEDPNRHLFSLTAYSGNYHINQPFTYPAPINNGIISVAGNNFNIAGARMIDARVGTGLVPATIALNLAGLRAFHDAHSATARVSFTYVLDPLTNVRVVDIVYVTNVEPLTNAITPAVVTGIAVPAYDAVRAAAGAIGNVAAGGFTGTFTWTQGNVFPNPAPSVPIGAVPGGADVGYHTIRVTLTAAPGFFFEPAIVDDATLLAAGFHPWTPGGNTDAPVFCSRSNTTLVFYQTHEVI